MGTPQPTDMQFRVWGASENLHAVGLFETTVENVNGVSILSIAYLVDCGLVST